MSYWDEWEDRRRRRRRDPFLEFFEEVQRMFERLFEGSMRGFDDWSELSSGYRLDRRPGVYGWSITIGPDGEPIVRAFGTPSRRAVVREEPVPAKEPIVDIFEEDGEVVVVAELPGVRKEDIKLNASGDSLEIRASGSFYKVIKLPSRVDPERAKATFNNGVLEVRLPKK